MDTISEVMGAIGLGLMPLVLVGLSVLALWVCERLGGYTVEWIRRVFLRRRSEEAAALGWWEAWLPKAHAPHGSLLARFQAHQRESVEVSDAVLDDLDLAATRQLSYLALGIRIGPVLGLMGTLIPLGPALLELRPDNLKAFSHSLSIAFGATVIGLFISGTCYLLVFLRKLWDIEDMSWIDRWMRAQHAPRTALTARSGEAGSLSGAPPAVELPVATESLPSS